MLWKFTGVFIAAYDLYGNRIIHFGCCQTNDLPNREMVQTNLLHVNEDGLIEIAGSTLVGTLIVLIFVLLIQYNLVSL